MRLHFSRRQFMTLMSQLACLPLVSGCAFESKPITIGMHIWPGYEPTPLAQKMGWLDEQLVKLVQTNSASESLKLLEQGKIDAAGLTLDEVLRARGNGIPLSVVLVCDISAGADQFLVRPEINSLAEIKGHRIGVEEGALGALMLYQVLQATGLTIEDVELVSLSPDLQVDAWRHGKVDAAVTYEPVASQIAEMAGKKLFDSSMTPELIVDVLAVRSSLLDYAHDEALHNLVASHLKALRYLQTHQDDAAYQLAPRLKLPPEQVMLAFKGLVLPDLNNNIRLLATSNPALLNSAALVTETMLKAKILPAADDLKALIRPEYLPIETP